MASEGLPERVMSMMPIIPPSSWARMWQWKTVAPTKRLKCMRIRTTPRDGSGTTSCSLRAWYALPSTDMTSKSFTWMWKGCSSREVFVITHSSAVPSLAT